MNWAVLRREWGAVTFVLTVIVGMLVVPLALYLANQGPGATALPTTITTVSPQACVAQIPLPEPKCLAERLAERLPESLTQSFAMSNPKSDTDCLAECFPKCLAESLLQPLTASR